MKLFVTFLILPVAFVELIKIDDDLEMNLELVKHQSCNYRKGKFKFTNLRFTRKLRCGMGEETRVRGRNGQVWSKTDPALR